MAEENYYGQLSDIEIANSIRDPEWDSIEDRAYARRKKVGLVGILTFATGLGLMVHSGVKSPTIEYNNPVKYKGVESIFETLSSYEKEIGGGLILIGLFGASLVAEYIERRGIREQRELMCARARMDGIVGS